MSVYKNGVEQVVIHGAAEHTDITREIFLPACEGYVTDGTPGVSEYYSVVVGGVDADEPVVSFTMKVPDDFVSFSSLKAIWLHLAGGDMFWRLVAYYGACEQARSTHSDIPAKGVTTSGGDIIKCQEPINALALASLAPGDFIGIQFDREGSDDSDTLEVMPMELYGLLFTYVANQ